MNPGSDPIWEKFAANISEGMLEAEKKAKRREAIRTIFTGILAWIAIACLFGLALMLVNDRLVDAYPNAVWLQPGIGYRDATILSFIAFLARSVWNSLQRGIDRSIRNNT
jgi:hypothetical protein